MNGAAPATWPPFPGCAERPHPIPGGPIHPFVRFAIFFGISLTLALALHYYVGVRLAAGFSLGRTGRHLLLVGLFALFLTIPLGIFIARTRPESALAHPAAWIAFLWMGFFSLFLTVLVFSEPLRLLARHVGPLVSTDLSGVSSGRRDFLSWGFGATVVAAVGALGAYGLREALRRPRVVRVPIAHPGAPAQGYRIVQISDIHIGPTVGRDFLAAVVEEVNALDPDIVVFTGDLADGTVDDLRDGVAPLADLRARDGLFFVTGNHEYYTGEPLAWIEEMRTLGFTPLVNEHRLVERDGFRLLVCGVPDYHAFRFLPEHASSPGAALKGAPESDFRLLLAHQPRTSADATGLGYDLQLSGHTHGGQFFPWNFFVPLQQPFVAGMHRQGDLPVYVNRGTGYWGPPLRIGSPSEITEIVLTPG